MRTTVTIDPDVEQILRQAMQQTGQGFKTVLNEAVRKGLAGTVVEKDEAPFVVRAKDMGLAPGIDLNRINQSIDELEVEGYLEVTRQLVERRDQAGR
ncbi:Antitoxin VapB33 [Pirellulimonas nuda]|uniref:Antitoxin VapB33 n=1 Tax=Pirellulimonas nuda TaxID=2528009 RepID=A0A518D7M3_9BACT|nr:antitoxin [Pirellulimonas nuda]QDU87480.1 Antitoxin VapB33 [Pirellulimonas nuda]